MVEKIAVIVDEMGGRGGCSNGGVVVSRAVVTMLAKTAARLVGFALGFMRASPITWLLSYAKRFPADYSKNIGAPVFGRSQSSNFFFTTPQLFPHI